MFTFMDQPSIAKGHADTVGPTPGPTLGQAGGSPHCRRCGGVPSFLGLCCTQSFRPGCRGGQGAGLPGPYLPAQPLGAPLLSSLESLLRHKGHGCVLCHPHRSQPDISATAPKLGVCAALSASWPPAVDSRRGWGRWCDPMGWAVGPPGSGCRERQLRTEDKAACGSVV